MADKPKMEARMVPGGQTFGGEIIKVHSGKRQARAYWLKDRAENRLLVLLVKGEEGDRLTRSFPHIGWRDRRSLADQEQFARLPSRVKLIILRGRREDLEKELIELMKSGTPVKQRKFVPTIIQQIKELDEDMGYLADEVGNL
jgi:hypothetical protein